MILTVLKNLFSTPATRRYPFKDVREPVNGFRGKITFPNVSTCKLCGMCAKVCPAKALEINKQARQIKYSPFNCIYCGACQDACPTHTIVQSVIYAPPAATKSVETIDIPAPPPAAKPVEKPA
jgi:ech hydrogenase subunit F